MSMTVVSTRLPAPDAIRLQALADERRVSVSDLVRYFLTMQLHRSA
jgi:hypothetical protein